MIGSSYEPWNCFVFLPASRLATIPPSAWYIEGKLQLVLYLTLLIVLSSELLTVVPLHSLLSLDLFSMPAQIYMWDVRVFIHVFWVEGEKRGHFN